MTENPPAPTEPETQPRARRRGRLLSQIERDSVLDLLAKGWGRALVCRKIGISYQTLMRTMEECKGFHRQVLITVGSLDENVQMALYKSALEGSVTAQTFWLKNRQSEDKPAAETAETSPPTTAQSNLENLSDEQIIERARAAGIDLPPRVARRLAKAHGTGRPGHVPPATLD